MRMRLQNRVCLGALAAALAAALAWGGASAAQEARDPSEMRLREQFSDQLYDPSRLDDTRLYPYYADSLAEALAAGVRDYAGAGIPFQLVEGRQLVQEGALGHEGPVILWQEDAASRITFSVEAPEDAFYCITYEYAPYGDEMAEAMRGFLLDGQPPFREVVNLRFPWVWQEKHAPLRNQIGDDVRPPHQMLSLWQTEVLRDGSGYYDAPYRFYLTQGFHTVTLTDLTQPLALSTIKLCAPKTPISYAQVSASYDLLARQAVEPVVFQAEDSVTGKSAASIQRVVSDDPASVPFEYGYKRLNALGGAYWSEGNQWVTWRFAVPEDGLYKLALRALNDLSGLPVYRTLLIDGDVPFSEMVGYSFPYSQEYRVETLCAADGEPYLFKLDKGEHTLTMRITFEANYRLIRSMMALDDLLSKVTLDLLMLTGPNPDLNYDYDIRKAMPGIDADLAKLQVGMIQIADEMNSMARGRTTTAENSFRQFAVQLSSCIGDIPMLQRHEGDLTGVQSSLGTWQAVLAEQPLAIDAFMLIPAGAAIQADSATMGQKAYATMYSFALSFSKDYENVGGTVMEGKDEVIDVWAAMGMENAEILKNLCDERFTPETGIRIKLNIMPGGQLNSGSVNALMLGIISGNAPDVALGAGRGAAAEFAIRDAVVDLSKLPGYQELAAQFLPETLKPDSFMGGQYGMPERIDFRVLFYRKDILGKLGVRLPDTWKDVYDNTLPLLYQSNLRMSIPQEYTGFSMFLMQGGGAFYTPDGLAALLSSPESHQAFEDTVSLYTKYGVPYTVNFYNRFQIGDMPLGFGGIGEYMSLSYGAPNLAGKWGIAPIPGTEQADGTISRAYMGMVQSSAFILSQSKKQEAAWAFLRWWLSSDTQEAYANEVEIRIGGGSRVSSANIEAFKHLPLPPADMQVIQKALSDIREVCGVLGGYYTERHIKNAWNRIIIDEADMLPRDSLDQAVEDITREMEAKQQEYPQWATGRGKE